MRQRRIDRLLMRARLAQEEGRGEEAREALAEAEQLGADISVLPELPLQPPTVVSAAPALESPAAEVIVREIPVTSIEEEISVRPVELDRIGPRVRTGIPAWVPRVAAAVTVIAGLGWGAVPVFEPPARNTPPPAMGSPTEADAASAATAPPDTELPPVHLSVTEVPATMAVLEPVGPTREVQPTSLAGGDVPRPAATSDEPAERSDLRALPAVAILEPPVPASPPVVPVGGTPPIEANLAAAGPAPVAPPAPDPVPAAPMPASRTTALDDAGVRTALAAYESAYSKLDAEAAENVWPGLDRKKLARAFEGLASQKVNLGSCDVRMSDEVAVASCAGSATWTPKVGGGTRSEPRRWQFRLRNGAAGWQIVGATVR